MNGKLCNFHSFSIAKQVVYSDKLGTFLENSIVTDTFQGIDFNQYLNNNDNKRKDA